MKLKGINYALLIIAFIVVSCKNESTQNQDSTKKIAVKTQKVEFISINKSLKISGNIDGNKTVRTGFLVAGKINYIAAQEGETIEKGELLASLDPESYEIALEMADANLSQMQDDFNRIKELYDRNSVTESDYVKITNGLRVAKAQRRFRAKDLEDTKLYSPIKGVMLKRGVEVGEIIDKGMQIFGVSDIYKVKVIASVPEMELRHVKKGRMADVYIPSLDSTFIGEIIEIGTLADPATRTFNIKIELNNPELLIRPGMTAEVNIQTADVDNRICIPANAVLRDVNNASYVYLVDNGKQKAFKRTISLGNIRDNNIEVMSGLRPDDMIVVSGQHKLSNGALIKEK